MSDIIKVRALSSYLVANILVTGDGGKSVSLFVAVFDVVSRREQNTHVMNCINVWKCLFISIPDKLKVISQETLMSLLM